MNSHRPHKTKFYNTNNTEDRIAYLLTSFAMDIFSSFVAKC